uniref:Lipoprotein n=1 Tax=Angiostrongylus cantonensis TaxID=6313 RepID=A0A0K0D7C0_ANGCA
MIRSQTVAVGCSGAMCGPVSTAANVNVGEQVYMPGTPCRDDSQCTRFSPAYCDNGLSLVARGLAKNGEYPSENAPPASRMDLMVEF